jgi:hypothetical protein
MEIGVTRLAFLMLMAARVSRKRMSAGRERGRARVSRNRVSDELEGKDQSNEACIENKYGGELGLISICPWPASPGPYI